ncbi:MAG: type I glyceraldehyde-3-phosphate dehydrogenase [Gemmatimonadota bacterium]
MTTRVAINGFGRIGRNILRAAYLQGTRFGGDLSFVAVNDLTDNETLAHLFRYDSVHGRFPGTVEASGDRLVVDGDDIQVLTEPEPGELPWDDLGVDIVLEATGRFRARSDAARHLEAGARKVIITAPATDPDVTVVLGVNQDAYDPEAHDVISNASCTTNCVAPVVKVLIDEFGFERGLLNTVHSYTTSQNILDLPHKDLRRARAAALSIIPTTTGAARATALVLPEVEGKLDGMAMRVPTPDVSIVDLVANLSEQVSTGELNDAFRRRAEGDLEGILAFSDEPLVSVDYTGHPASSIVDGVSTEAQGGRMVRVVAWYDNEWGYSSRCLDLAGYASERLSAPAPS